MATMFVPQFRLRAAARAAQPHRSARIGLHQVADAHRVLLVHVEQSRVAARTSAADSSVTSPLTSEPAMVASLFGLRFGWPFASRPVRPVVDEAELARHQMLAGRAVEHEEVAVARAPS